MKTVFNKTIKTIFVILGLTLLIACGNSSGGSSDTTASDGSVDATTSDGSADATASGGSSDATDTSGTDPVFSSSNSIVVNENTSTTFTVLATGSSEISYSISGGDASDFTLNGTTGEISFNEVPNYEQKNSYAFIVTATDNSSNSSTQELSISIVDIEESIGKFIISVNTSNTGTSSAVEFTIPTDTTTYPAGYNYNVDCDNDGLNEATEVRGNYTCEYDGAGIYSIAIEGDFPQIYFNGAGDNAKLISIDQWGTNVWKSMETSFYGCSNLAGQASDNPNLSDVESMVSMFNGASIFDQNISGWDVSGVSDMSTMFSDATSFNKDIGSWNVSNVMSMFAMFANANSFDQNLSSWKVHNVTNMSFMFSGATSFDQNIGVWQPYGVMNMSSMFTGVTLSPENYKLLLEGWAFKKANLPRGIHFSAGNSKIPFSTIVHPVTGVSINIPDGEAEAARNTLKDGIDGPEWNITDGD